MSIGSNPMFPKIKKSSYIYISNNYNLLSSKKLFFKKLLFFSQNFKYIKILYKLGVVNHYLILKSKKIKFIKFNLTYYKQKPFFKHIKIVSKPSKKYVITYNALKIIYPSLKNSIILIETNKGILTQTEALFFKLGGLLISIIL